MKSIICLVLFYVWVDINMNSVKAVDLPSKYNEPLLLVAVQLSEDTASLEIVFKLRPFVGFGSFFWPAICTWWLLLSVSEHVPVFNGFQMFSLGWNESSSPFVQSPKHFLNGCMGPLYQYLVDCPTQLIYLDFHLFMCSMTKLKGHSREICQPIPIPLKT